MFYVDREFSLYKFENKLIKDVNSLYPDKDSNDGKKKRRELFHLLVFRELSIPYKKYKIYFSERPDFVLKKIFKNVGIEITEVIDYGQNDKNLNELLDILLEQRDGEIPKNIIAQECSQDAKEKMKKQYDEKHRKFNESNWQKFKQNILLLVTMESVDNPCPTTGYWFERVFTKDEILGLKKDFSRIYILNYNASPKDGGPILKNINDIIEYRKILYGE